MQSPQAKLKEINRLLSAFPPGNWLDPEEAMRGYLLAVEDWHADVVTVAVDALIKGSAPGVNPSFLPPPSVVGAECRRQNQLLAERAEREKRFRPALPAPDIEHSPESRARVRALVERVTGKLNSEAALGEDRHRARVDQANAYFDPPRGFSVGDPEGAEDAA